MGPNLLFQQNPPFSQIEPNHANTRGAPWRPWCFLKPPVFPEWNLLRYWKLNVRGKIGSGGTEMVKIAISNSLHIELKQLCGCCMLLSSDLLISEARQIPTKLWNEYSVLLRCMGLILHGLARPTTPMFNVIVLSGPQPTSSTTFFSISGIW